MNQVIVVLLFLQLSIAMLIPEDTEMLEGFGPASFPEISPEDDYFEARSMNLGALFNSIRNKRAAKYDVNESNGLASHFRPNTVNAFTKEVSDGKGKFTQPGKHSFRKIMQWLKRKLSEEESSSSEESYSNGGNIILIPRRHRRSTDTEKKPKNAVEIGKLDQRTENQPSAMRLDKTSSTRDNPSASPLIGKFVRSPFEYSKIQHEEDSIAMDTSSLSMNEGMKSRTPRVNFVTQQKKSLDHDDTKASATKTDFYKTPPLLHNSKESAAISSSEKYPDRGSTSRPVDTYSIYKDRDTNNNRYDDRYIEDMYPPPPDTYDSMYDFNGPYDPYMRRVPYADYSSGYSGNRYDIPDYRDYPPMYGNEVDNRYFMRSDMMPPPISTSAVPRKRTIYYAYLPEVVRSPPTVDFRYRSYDRYDPYYSDLYNYEANLMRNAYRRPIPDRQRITEKASMVYDYRTARPIKHYNDDISRNNPSAKEKKFDADKFYNENKMHAYPHRRSNEFDPYLY